ncbi:hypothetical protein [Spongiactinospora sp. TRM90649]|uniref:hypothetical protein n=1 Tax=Spongiactinospora sp. TRM90649 TaxID=3031114 RepID=UPI0023F8BA4E|nr:hypothetical protein [Spongiactinospora sp. TRM90649]MDF5755478.1 hypothetical protein [Spongiactinospora sp. TRM90649]
MARLGPALTLAAGGLVAATLGVLSVSAASSAGAPHAARAETQSAEATTGATPPKAVKTARQAPARADYAGRVKGNGGLIAVSVRGGKVIAYFCDGKAEAWFTGRAGDGEVTLKGFGEATVSTRLGDGKASGELAIGGKTWDFTAPVAKKPSGLYRASAIVRGARVKAGWIVLADGTQTGAARLDDRPVEAPVLTPGTDPTIEGTRVDAKDVDEFIGEMP